MIDLAFISKLNNFLLDHPTGSVTRLVTSVTHNKMIGGAQNSAHLFKNGNAVDLIFDTDDDLYDAAIAAKHYGFSGIELDVTNKHLHLDTKPRQWMVVHEKEHETPLEDWIKTREV